MSTMMKEVITDEWPRKHRITVNEYHRMAEEGLLAPDARVELIEGEIIDMAPIGSPHGSIVDRLNHAFVHAVGRRAIVRVQGAVRLSERNEPQPDLALLKPRRDHYSKSHPGPSETLLLIEVSDTTLRYDRQIKCRYYARYDIPEVWIIDTRARKLHVFRGPTKGNYHDTTSTSRPGVMALAALPGVEVDLPDLLSL